MGDKAGNGSQRSVQLNPETVTIFSEIDSDGELKLQIQGDIRLRTDVRYENVRVESTVRSAEKRVLVREDTYVDLNYVVEGQTAFSMNLYLKPEVGKGAATVELRANAQVIEVDSPTVLEIPAPKKPAY